MKPAATEALLAESSAGLFDPSELDDQLEPVRRHLSTTIAPGTPLARSARLTMRGHIKIGRWVPFHAEEVLSPHRGFIWRARVAGLITGSDQYVAGEGAMTWRLAGLIPFIRAGGADLARSAAGRAGGEAQWLPTALLPRFGVRWSAEADDRVTSRYDIDGVPIEVHHRIDERGVLRSTVFQRWGDPDRTGSWDWHPCGGEVTAFASFGGLRIPSEGRLGWHFGTERWPQGEFFRYRITGLEALGLGRR